MQIGLILEGNTSNSINYHADTVAFYHRNELWISSFKWDGSGVMLEIIFTFSFNWRGGSLPPTVHASYAKTDGERDGVWVLHWQRSRGGGEGSKTVDTGWLWTTQVGQKSITLSPAGALTDAWQQLDEELWCTSEIEQGKKKKWKEKDEWGN